MREKVSLNLVAKRAFDASFDVLCCSLELLCFPLGDQLFIFGRFANHFLEVSGDLVAGGVQLVG